jgi:dTDP-glucose 4,6-dehydratase
MKRVLVTGGAGFIGSHLCRRLLAERKEVVCADNLVTGDLRNIEDLFGQDGFIFLKQDITQFIHVSGSLDAVFHLASPASPIDYLKLPIQTLKVGALGTHKVLGLAREKKARVLLASTSEVYGDPQVHPQTEDYWGHVNPIGPRGVYDEAKRFAEAMVMAYHRHHQLDTRIVRIFNTYGPRMRKDDGRVVPNFICQALAGEPITIYGQGQQTRSFCFVADMVEGLIAAMERSDADPVNLGNDSEISILDFARLVKKLTASDSELTFHEMPVDDPKVRRPDITRARQVLGWEPKVALHDGLGKTIEYFRILENPK